MYAIELISSFVPETYAAELFFIPAPRAAIFDSVWANSSSRLILDAWISASAFANFSESWKKYRISMLSAFRKNINKPLIYVLSFHAYWYKEF